MAEERTLQSSRSEEQLVQLEHPIAPANNNANVIANLQNAAELPTTVSTDVVDSHSQQDTSTQQDAPSQQETSTQQTSQPASPQQPVTPVRTQRRYLTEAEILRNFIVNPAPPGRKVFCHVIRRQSPLNPYCNYELYLEQPEQPPKFIMNARKTPKSRTALYRISLVKNNYDPASLIGRVRSNFLGTTFTVYDKGRNPFKHQDDDPDEEKHIRQELASVVYEANVMGFKGPRKMTIVLPQMTSDAKFTNYAPTKESDTLAEKFIRDPESLLVLYNKSPQWNEETQSFVLNFGGRVTLASVKNFQITHPDDLDYVVLQFGRVSEEKFTMDFQFPLTCLQAFGIALSSFDGKIACE